MTESFRAFRTTLLNRFFTLLYNDLAVAYDIVADVVSVGAWKTWIQETIPFLNPGKVLEVGHGPGHLLPLLQRSQNRVTGLDLSANMGRTAQARLRTEDLSVSLVNADALAMPFRSNLFDTVVATFPSPYIFSNRSLKEIHRTLRSGGRFICLPAVQMLPAGIFTALALLIFTVAGLSSRTIEEAANDQAATIAAAGFRCTAHIRPTRFANIVLLVAEKP